MAAPHHGRRNNSRNRTRQAMGKGTQRRASDRSPKHVKGVFSYVRDAGIVEALPKGQAVDKILSDVGGRWKLAENFGLFLLTKSECYMILGSFDVVDRYEVTDEIKRNAGKLALTLDGCLGKEALVSTPQIGTHGTYQVGIGLDVDFQKKVVNDRRILLGDFSSSLESDKNFCITIAETHDPAVARAIEARINESVFCGMYITLGKAHL